MESLYEKRPLFKLHNSFENLKGLYYFDMIKQRVLHLTLCTTFLEPKLPNLTWKHID